MTHRNFTREIDTGRYRRLRDIHDNHWDELAPSQRAMLKVRLSDGGQYPGLALIGWLASALVTGLVIGFLVARVAT